jgi:cytochrome P450
MGGDIRKHTGLYKSFDVDEASVGFIDPKQHKIRREILNPMFQPKAIARLEYVLQEKVVLSKHHIFSPEISSAHAS